MNIYDVIMVTVGNVGDVNVGWYNRYKSNLCLYIRLIFFKFQHESITVIELFLFYVNIGIIGQRDIFYESYVSI